MSCSPGDLKEIIDDLVECRVNQALREASEDAFVCIVDGKDGELLLSVTAFECELGKGVRDQYGGKSDALFCVRTSLSDIISDEIGGHIAPGEERVSAAYYADPKFNPELKRWRDIAEMIIDMLPEEPGNSS